MDGRGLKWLQGPPPRGRSSRVEDSSIARLARLPARLNSASGETKASLLRVTLSWEQLQRLV